MNINLIFINQFLILFGVTIGELNSYFIYCFSLRFISQFLILFGVMVELNYYFIYCFSLRFISCQFVFLGEYFLFWVFIASEMFILIFYHLFTCFRTFLIDFLGLQFRLLVIFTLSSIAHINSCEIILLLGCNVHMGIRSSKFF